MLARLVHISFSQFRAQSHLEQSGLRVIWSRLPSENDAWMCLSVKWKPVETNIDQEQKLKSMNSFGTFRAIVSVIEEAEEPQNQERVKYHTQ